MAPWLISLGSTAYKSSVPGSMAVYMGLLKALRRPAVKEPVKPSGPLTWMYVCEQMTFSPLRQDSYVNWLYGLGLLSAPLLTFIPLCVKRGQVFSSPTFYDPRFAFPFRSAEHIGGGEHRASLNSQRRSKICIFLIDTERMKLRHL